MLITWVGPDGVNISDERFNIMPTTNNGSNFTSILQFDYLAESDVGTYNCNIVSNRSTFTFPVVLQDFRSKRSTHYHVNAYICIMNKVLYTYKYSIIVDIQ